MKRAVRTVIRFIAAGMVIVGGMNVGLEFVRRQVQEADLDPWRLAIGLLAVVAGIALFAASAALAAKMTDDIDE
jgi:hypothetical protein